MNVWRPWDADDDEYSELLAIRELIPEPMESAVYSWLHDRLTIGYDSTSQEIINSIQSALRINFGFDPGGVNTDAFVNRIRHEGDQFTIRVVDFVLSAFSPSIDYRMPKEVAELEWHLDQNMSAVCIQVDGSDFRIARRLPLGIEEIARGAVSNANEVAGRHLSKSWSEAQSLTPDTAAVMTEAIRAVEAAAGPVVIPKERRPQLSKIVGALRDNASWTLVLPTRDDNHPDHRAVLIGMLETLAFAEQHRHSGTDPSAVEALTHVQLASTLVAWFSIGSVVKA